MRKSLPRTGVFDYQVARSNEAWPDHRGRTLVTASLIAWLRPGTVMDPACGDASIVEAAIRLFPMKAYLADISEPNIKRLSGHETMCTDINLAIDAFPEVDVMVLTEILEHLPDPDAVLRASRNKAKYLIASSPEMRPGQNDNNPEHLWQFDHQGYEAMLVDAHWKVQQYTSLQFESEYNFGIWVCS